MWHHSTLVCCLEITPLKPALLAHRAKRPGQGNGLAPSISVCGAVPFFGVVTGIVRIAQRRPRMDSLARMGRGVMVTMAALVQTNTGSSSQAAIGFLVEQTREWMAEDGFNLDVTRRAGKLAFMT